MEKTTDENLSCLTKDLQLEKGEKTIDLTKNLLQGERLNSSRIQASPPERATNSSTSRNTSNISVNMCSLDFLSSQDEKLLNILEELQNRMDLLVDFTAFMGSNRLKGHFFSDTIFNSSQGSA